MKKLLALYAINFFTIYLSHNCMAQSTLPHDTTKKVFTFVEVMPQYPGGDDALIKFLQKNIHYPPTARDNNIQGTVFLTFVVDYTGAITGIKILRDIGGGCGDEAVRVVKLMPNWLPGKQNGDVVSVQYNLPIKFQLADDSKKHKKKSTQN